MSTGPPDTMTAAVADALADLHDNWPGFDWQGLERLYRRELESMQKPETVRAAVTELIASSTDPSPPPRGALVAALTAVRERERARTSVRGRRSGVTFQLAKPHAGDPPGAQRWVVVQPDGRRLAQRTGHDGGWRETIELETGAHVSGIPAGAEAPDPVPPPAALLERMRPSSSTPAPAPAPAIPVRPQPAGEGSNPPPTPESPQEAAQAPSRPPAPPVTPPSPRKESPW